jgi:hypothetical protein
MLKYKGYKIIPLGYRNKYYVSKDDRTIDEKGRKWLKNEMELSVNNITEAKERIDGIDK